MGIYELIESYNNKEIFRNSVIIIIFLFIFMNLSIGLNIVFGLILAFCCILYLTGKKYSTDKIEIDENNKKLEYLKPTPTKITDDKNIVDFIFSVQDFYVFNPLAFEEFIDNLDAFKTIYLNIFNDSKLSHYYYQIADSKKNNALNAFHSLIFSLPNNKVYTEKFNRAHKRLETILNKYINEIYDECDQNIIKYGYDLKRTPINKGPKEYNHYFDKDFSYQFY